MQLFDDFGTDLTGGPGGIATAESLTYYPTLLIGLGGTGAQALLRLKRTLMSRLSGGAAALHRFVFLDPDQRTFARQAGMPPIERHEGVLMGVNQASRLIERPHLHPHVWARFPKKELKESHIARLGQGEGAGQIRSVGALALVIDYPNVRTAIERAVGDLDLLSNRAKAQAANANAEIGKGILIYTVGSLAGGTGSGCFIDVAMIAKDICNAKAWTSRVVGLFALPERFDEKVSGDPGQPDRIRANTYAALKELQFVLDTDAARSSPIVFDYGDGQKLPLAPHERLFDFCYLVDHRNALGALSRLEDLYELMARSMYQDVGSNFGAHARSFDANTGVRTGVDKCPETNRPRLFSSVATASLVYPAERVASCCTYRTLEEVLRERLLEPSVSRAEAAERVTVFLRDHQLDERRPMNQILDSLLLEESRKRPLSDRYLLPKNFGSERNGAQFVELIRERRQAFREAEPVQVQPLVTENKRLRVAGADPRAVTDPIGDALRSWVLQVAAETGAAGAARMLQELHEVVVGMRRELEQELHDWSTHGFQQHEQQLNKLCDGLASMGRVAQVLTSKDEKLKLSILMAFNTFVRAQLLALATPSAIDVLNVLENRTAGLLATWQNLISDLERLAAEARQRWQALQTGGWGTGPTRDFVVELEVTQPGYEMRYYDANRKKSAAAFAKIVEAFEHRGQTGRDGGPIAVYRWMAEIEGLERPRLIGVEFSKVILDAFWKDLLDTDIVKFVDQNPDEVSQSFDVKLGLLFDMCQAFWPAQPIEANQRFAEFDAVSSPFHKGSDAQSVPPRSVESWLDSYRKAGTAKATEIIPGAAPYEVVLSRRTHGARAYYLTTAPTWRAKYLVVERAARGDYMLATHQDFLDIPDLFPGQQRAVELFALGLGLGLVAARGDWYYFNLEEQGEGPARVIRVRYDSQWPTLHKLEVANAPPVPRECGSLRFEMKEAKIIPPKLRLAQGHELAMEALEQHAEWMGLMREALDTYHQAVGNNALRAQLRAYLEGVIESYLEGGATPRAGVFEMEKQAVEGWLSRLEA